MHVQRVQEWWCAGTGPAAVGRSPILAAIEPGILAELVGAGGGYHTILTSDRLDGLHRCLANSTEASVEPLRKALQTRGGTKAQARVVGMLLFKEARSLHHQCEEEGFVAGPSATAVATTSAATTAIVPDEIRLDESWPSPRVYVCSDTYPEGAQMALRAGPSNKSKLMATLPANTEYHAKGIVGEFLQVSVQMENGASGSAYALHRMGDMVLLVPATPAVAQVTAASPQPTPTAISVAETVLDETWSPPRRFVCSESYPQGAQMAVRAAPNRESKQVYTALAGTDYLATGRCGDYLQVSLEIDGVLTAAYVTHTIGDMVLLVPAELQIAAASSAPAARAAAAAVAAVAAANEAAAAEAATGGRIVALEATVVAQERQIQALQAEMAEMRGLLQVVAIAFQPMAARPCGG